MAVSIAETIFLMFFQSLCFLSKV